METETQITLPPGTQIHICLKPGLRPDPLLPFFYFELTCFCAFSLARGSMFQLLEITPVGLLPLPMNGPSPVVTSEQPRGGRPLQEAWSASSRWLNLSPEAVWHRCFPPNYCPQKTLPNILASSLTLKAWQLLMETPAPLCVLYTHPKEHKLCLWEWLEGLSCSG